MRKICQNVLVIVGAAVLMSCTTTRTDQEEVISSGVSGNPLLAPWSGPYQGVPAFDKMDISALAEAMETGMKLSLAEIDLISSNPRPPTFANTIEAYENTGRDLDRAQTYWGIFRSNVSTPESRIVVAELAPKLSEYSSKITQNQALFDRVRTVYESNELKTLRPDQQRLTWLVYNRFAHNGAALSTEKKERYAAINKQLSELYTAFSNNVLADEENYVVYLNQNQLGGLPESLVAATAAAATERGRDGQYAISNTRSSMDPFLTFSDERDLREKVWRNYYSRGDNGDQYDNNRIIAEILQLRHERVQLMGYENYAQWRLEDRMARSPDRALGLMEAIWPAAIERAAEEVADMQAIARSEGADITIEPWDYRYYAEKVRQDRYALDSEEIKQYLQLDKLREAMFFVAGELFRFEFTPVPDGSVPVFHPDVKVWEVTDKDSGKHIGLWYLDPFSRKGKRSGAWATRYRSHESFDQQTNVLASNNSNFVKGQPGEAVLISWDDAETLFHEFGHALHYLSSKVAYPTLNNGVRDYTEFQSQLLEHWLLTDKVTRTYLIHHKTNQPMPAELIKKIKTASTFNRGFKETEYLASAIVDLKYHMTDPAGINPDTFERQTLAKMGMPRAIVMRHRSPHFGHIFSSEGYAAGYYGYLWADVLTADASEAFAAAPGGYYDRDLAKKLVDNLFAIGNALDPTDAYRAFRGRDARVEAVMRSYGFAGTDSAAAH